MNSVVKKIILALILLLLLTVPAVVTASDPPGIYKEPSFQYFVVIRCRGNQECYKAFKYWWEVMEVIIKSPAGDVKEIYTMDQVWEKSRAVTR